MIKNILVCLLFITSSFTIQANTDNTYFSTVLKLEEKWQKLSTKTIKRYISHIEKKGFFKNIAPTEMAKVDYEITTELKNQLTWDKVGRKTVSTLLSGCSQKTLKGFAEALEGKLTRTEGLSAASAYEKCAAIGVKKTIPIMQKEIMKATPNIINILKKHQK